MGTNVKVRVLPGSMLSDNRSTYGPGDELDMLLGEANRRIAQGKVQMVGTAQPALNDLPGKLSAADAIAAAKAACNMEVLAELKAGEERKTVLAAIEAREKELTGIGDGLQQPE
jgi:hypothetical protein